MGAKPNKDLISTMLLTILHGVGSIHQNTNVTTRTFNRGEEIVNVWSNISSNIIRKNGV